MNTRQRAPGPALGSTGVAVSVLGVWLAAAGFPAPVAAPDGFVLASRGTPSATIVVPMGAGAADPRAAAILRDAVRAMSGATLPIVEKARPGRGREAAIGTTSTISRIRFRRFRT